MWMRENYDTPINTGEFLEVAEDQETSGMLRGAAEAENVDKDHFSRNHPPVGCGEKKFQDHIQSENVILRHLLPKLKMKKNFYVAAILVASILIARGTVVSPDPITEVDCDTMIVQLRELYRILMSNGGIPGFHAMVRKAQRVPSLRLRFGKRFTPDWAEPNKSAENEKDQFTD
ncbi:uncharacterized protein TNCV_2886401 [Trichonephila clavipes]|nr:uncharacterized protein TNCV_2886401 [Trichonephila clavipes]